jgi:hypothetical protein
MLHLCGLIQDGGWTNCLFVVCDDIWQWWSSTGGIGGGIQGGMNDGRSKKGHLAKVKYLDFLEEILDSSKWIDVWTNLEKCLHV